MANLCSLGDRRWGYKQVKVKKNLLDDVGKLEYEFSLKMEAWEKAPVLAGEEDLIAAQESLLETRIHPDDAVAYYTTHVRGKEEKVYLKENEEPPNRRIITYKDRGRSRFRYGGY